MSNSIQLATADLSVGSSTTLFIALTAHSASYCCLDTTSGELIAFGHSKNSNDQVSSNDLQELKNILPAPVGRFGDIYISYEPSIYSLVPGELFASNKAATYLEFDHTIPSDASVKHAEINEMKAELIFSLPNELIKDAEGLSYKTKWLHPLQGTLRILAKERKHDTDNALYIFTHPWGSRTIAYKGGQLLLCNDHPGTATDDVVYFCLAVCEQLQFNLHTVNAYLYQEDGQELAEQSKLKEQLPNLKMGYQPRSLKYNNSLSELASDKWFSLLSMAICA